MMPVIRVSDATFSDLKAISTWLGTKTPGETIDQIAKKMMSTLGMERDEGQDAEVQTDKQGMLQFKNTPGLSFTKPITARVGAKTVVSPRWSSILITVIEQVRATGLTGKDLMGAINVPAKLEVSEEEGFRFYPQLGLSLQGQSAADAWKETERLAQAFSIPVKVEFVWRQHSKAQYPGKWGVLRVG